jgi:hypothetical protein
VQIIGQRAEPNHRLILSTSWKITEEEADESNYFIDILSSVENNRFQKKLTFVSKESRELTAIYSAAILTTRKNQAESLSK